MMSVYNFAYDKSCRFELVLQFTFCNPLSSDHRFDYTYMDYIIVTFF